mmetsp:Transcript_49433/g.92644  ORF Transcript_49433/g.92644 Transcript_49433/m.92644 type:complete len:89 (+) Transcript_49433:33-299(+)
MELVQKSKSFLSPFQEPDGTSRQAAICCAWPKYEPKLCNLQLDFLLRHDMVGSQGMAVLYRRLMVKYRDACAAYGSSIVSVRLEQPLA